MVTKAGLINKELDLTHISYFNIIKKINILG